MIIHIDKKTDILLTMSPICEVTGHIFECFDYYLLLHNHFNVKILFFNGVSYENLKKLFNYKYTVDFSIVEKDIIYFNIENLMEQKYFIFDNKTKVLLVDGNVKGLDFYNIHLMTRQRFGFICAEPETITNDLIHKNITFLCDHRIYKNTLKTKHYIKKMPFKYYRKSNKKFDNTGLMYTTYVCRKVTPAVLEDYHKRSGCTKSILVVPYPLPEYDHLNGITQVVAPIKDLFDKFDVYIYTPVQRKFDCSSRLITECFINHKKVFIDLDYTDIALSVRYNDCLTNLQSLDLTDTDDIFSLLQ